MKPRAWQTIAFSFFLVSAMGVFADNNQDDEDAPEQVVRDPFWPVGYEPPSRRDSAEVVEVVRAVSWPELRVRGRTRLAGDDMMALIDGVGIARVGEIVSLRHQGQWFHWRVNYIDQRIVRIRRIGVSNEEHPSEEWIRDREEEQLHAEETI